MAKIAGSGSASGSGSICQRHGSADPDPDPDPTQNVMDPQHWYQERSNTLNFCQLRRKKAFTVHTKNTL
jgi:hypothetical protein